MNDQVRLDVGEEVAEVGEGQYTAQGYDKAEADNDAAEAKL